MADTPDFEQIARRLAGVWADRGVVQGMTESVAEQLRKVWNARGAADAHAVSLRAMEMLGTAGGGVYAEHFEKTIKGLDR